MNFNVAMNSPRLCLQKHTTQLHTNTATGIGSPPSVCSGSYRTLVSARTIAAFCTCDVKTASLSYASRAFTLARKSCTDHSVACAVSLPSSVLLGCCKEKHSLWMLVRLECSDFFASLGVSASRERKPTVCTRVIKSRSATFLQQRQRAPAGSQQFRLVGAYATDINRLLETGEKTRSRDCHNFSIFCPYSISMDLLLVSDSWASCDLMNSEARSLKPVTGSRMPWMT